jgi:hypothetical protein
MSGDEPAGVAFPASADGRRSTSALGQAVVADALARVDAAGALEASLHTGGGPEQAHPWQDEAHAAAYGGMWRVPYAPRSALGLAALLGYTAARNRT